MLAQPILHDSCCLPCTHIQPKSAKQYAQALNWYALCDVCTHGEVCVIGQEKCLQHSNVAIMLQVLLMALLDKVRVICTMHIVQTLHQSAVLYGSPCCCST
jgi:hypothetical protein